MPLSATAGVMPPINRAVSARRARRSLHRNDLDTIIQVLPFQIAQRTGGAGDTLAHLDLREDSCRGLAGAGEHHAVPGQLQLVRRSEEHTSELQSRPHLVCRLLLEK